MIECRIRIRTMQVLNVIVKANGDDDDDDDDDDDGSGLILGS